MNTSLSLSQQTMSSKDSGRSDFFLVTSCSPKKPSSPSPALAYSLHTLLLQKRIPEDQKKGSPELQPSKDHTDQLGLDGGCLHQRTERAFTAFSCF